jgi:hypothetical protein
VIPRPRRVGKRRNGLNSLELARAFAHTDRRASLPPRGHGARAVAGCEDRERRVFAHPTVQRIKAASFRQNSSGTSLSPRAATIASGNSRQNASTHSLGTVVLTLTKRDPKRGV